MTTALLMLGCLCQFGQPLPEFRLEYVRLAGDKYVLESSIAHAKGKMGNYVFDSTTHRPSEKLNLVVSWNKDQLMQSATVELESAQGKKKIYAKFQDKTATLMKPGQEEVKMELAAPPVLVTSAPDWSDIFIVLRRYDQKIGGKQEFAGLWLHPEKPAMSLTFTAEKLGDDETALANEKQKLGRYHVKLRSGVYLVWADNAGLVYKLMTPGQPKNAIVLKGHEKAVLGLTGAAP